MSTIVKIQRDPKSPCNRVIINNECRSITMETAMTPQLDGHLRDKDLVFAKVSFSGASFKLLGLVKKQNW